MKKFLSSAVFSVLLLSGVAFMVSMAPPDRYCNDICKLFVEEGLFKNQGRCISACTVCTNPADNEAQFAVCVCKTGSTFEEVDLPEDQCVATVKREIGEEPE